MVTSNQNPDSFHHADMVEVPVRVLSETETRFLVTRAPFAARPSSWLDKDQCEIADKLEVKTWKTARMARAYAQRRGLA